MTTLTRTEADIDRPQAPDILARVKEMRPWLREHLAMAEQQRRVPQESVERIDAAGVFSLTTPARFVWDACRSAIETLFRASGASAIMMRQSLQLIARNCRAGSLHAAYNIDTWWENVGRELCGAESAAISTSVLERQS